MKKNIFLTAFPILLLLFFYCCSEDSELTGNASSSTSSNQDYFCLSINSSFRKSPTRIQADSIGNTYLAGYFQGFADFNPGPDSDIHTSNGEKDIFLTKINTNGTYGWTRTFGSTFDDWTYDLKLDKQNNIYLVGTYRGTVNFNQNGTADTHTSMSYSDAFITKILANGNYAWTKTFGGTEGIIATRITLGNGGHIYITGGFRGSVDFDPGPGDDTQTSNGGNDIFITKINANGSYAWTKTIGGKEDDRGNCIATDSADNIYIVGNFNGTNDFDPGPGIDNHIAKEDHDLFITKIKADGTYGWTKTINSQEYPNYYISAYKVAIDSSDDIYIAGSFSGNVDFDPSDGTDNHTALPFLGSSYITKILANGTYGWTKSFYNFYYARSLALDNSGNIYITGFFEHTADFDPGSGEDTHTSKGGSDIFVSKLYPDGSYAWAKTFGGTENDRGRTLTLDNKGDLYIAGTFNGSITFDSNSNFTHTSIDGDDIFIMKMTNH